MKTFILSILTLTLLIPYPSSASPGKRDDTLMMLRREVSSLFYKKAPEYPDIPDQWVKVGFMVNAKNELIVLDVSGDSDTACEYVKQVLNYNKVNYCCAKQLTMYSISIHLVKGKV